MKTKTKAVCSTCGSDRVQRDAYAEWDTDSQRWELVATFDNAFCLECEGETIIEMIKLKK